MTSTAVRDWLGDRVEVRDALRCGKAGCSCGRGVNVVDSNQAADS